ncbi:MAG: hypothetical protein NPIRA05_11190 [Nitrospirales bacterium]|nr:MAG: hypothetical protein NPIRA05_11190 [Nitrospirales bacterium]
MKTVSHMRKAAIALFLGCSFLLPTPSLATSVLGGSLAVQNDGNVTATFQGSNAGYVSSLYLGDTKLFTSNQTSGSTFDLGNFTAGTQLQFRLEVHNTGQTFYTGNGANNADGLAHAIVNDSFGQGETLVSFEDLLGGGDKDYNDLIFSFSNTNTEVDADTNKSLVQNPEPSTVLLLGSGIIGLAAWRLRKERSLNK